VTMLRMFKLAKISVIKDRTQTINQHKAVPPQTTRGCSMHYSVASSGLTAMNNQLGTDTHPPLLVMDERVIACLDGAPPDIGALWELCVYLEWDREETVEGITAWLGPPEQVRIRDCACGSGFPAIDLARRGYDMTCSDGSGLMLDHFRRHARRAGVTLDAVLRIPRRSRSRAPEGAAPADAQQEGLSSTRVISAGHHFFQSLSRHYEPLVCFPSTQQSPTAILHIAQSKRAAHLGHP
jgi:hypothetical protein